MVNELRGYHTRYRKSEIHGLIEEFVKKVCTPVLPGFRTTWLKLFLCVRSDQTVHIKDIFFITRLLALEVKGISTYYQEESTAHDASMDEFERLSPLPGLNLGLWRREGPLDEVEKRIALLDRHPIQRIVFRMDHYAADDGSMFLAAYATAKDPPIKLITLSELLWFRAE